MKQKRILLILLTALLVFSLAACGDAAKAPVDPPSVSEMDPGTVPSENVSGPDGGGKVAGTGDMAPGVELDTEGLTPVYGTDLKDGVYEIDVDSSSSMFKIVSCTLTVENGEMTAVMTMGGTGYL